MPFSSGEKWRPRAGFFKFSCCTGCGFELAYFQRSLEDTLKSFDFAFFRLASSSGDFDSLLDLALVEGTVTEPFQAVELKKIRKNSAVLYAVGSCAIAGGIPAIKAGGLELEIEKRAYQKKLYRLTSIRPSVLGDYVKVDGCVRGCPPGRHDLEEALVSVLLDRKPEFIEYSVCVECKMKGNICLLVDEGLPCMGPVTNAGCGALCPSCHRACYSCFGLMGQANIPALKDKFRQLGLSGEEIERRFTLFDGLKLKK
ncbi:MAG: hypothetical protein M0Z75_02510 [Nitrospiraceae bacterium]|nr:hypothetical protein [Nitrospiraceae bacterium]